MVRLLTSVEKNMGRGAAVGYVYYLPPITYQLEQLLLSI